jgi:SNF2 family DNA or RNA helicase
MPIQRLLQLAEKSAYRIILNGTPLSRNLLDIWSQMEFLSPKILKMGLAEFKNTFCEYIKVTYHSQGFGRSYSKEFIKKYHNIDYLYSLIEPFIFESKLSLSIGQQHIDIDYTLTDEEKRQHDKLKEKYLDNEYLLARNNNIFLEITQKMQHNYSLSLSKFEIADKLLSEIDKSKVLIYAKYIDTQEALAKHYKDVRIMSLQKHSYGLNLQDYNVIIFWDKTWDYAQREQIERRIFRTGQNSECVYYDLTGNVGLENMINQNIERKRNLLDVFAGMSVEQLKKEL